jgi:hypothetical protein
MAEFGHLVADHQPILGAWAAALGDYGYILRSPDLEELLEVAVFIQKKEV